MSKDDPICIVILDLYEIKETDAEEPRDDRIEPNIDEKDDGEVQDIYRRVKPGDWD